LGDGIKEYDVAWMCCMHERKRNVSRIVMGKLKERNNLEDLDIDRIKLSWISRE
jgi:hypothetical protein